MRNAGRVRRHFIEERVERRVYLLLLGHHCLAGRRAGEGKDAQCLVQRFRHLPANVDRTEINAVQIGQFADAVGFRPEHAEHLADNTPVSEQRPDESRAARESQVERRFLAGRLQPFFEAHLIAADKPRGPKGIIHAVICCRTACRTKSAAEHPAFHRCRESRCRRCRACREAGGCPTARADNTAEYAACRRKRAAIDKAARQIVDILRFARLCGRRFDAGNDFPLAVLRQFARLEGTAKNLCLGRRKARNCAFGHIICHQKCR